MAQLYNPAHELAVLELAPDAVIRNDLDLLKNIFERFNPKKVDNWNIRGKVQLVSRCHPVNSGINLMADDRFSLIMPTS
jgi:hypothetical protein